MGVQAVGLEVAVADLLICGFADLRICLVADEIIPNFLLPLAFRKFILFGGKGEVCVWWKILFGMCAGFPPLRFCYPDMPPWRVQKLRAGKPVVLKES